MEKQRIYYWDNLKAILIFLVVLSHFLLPVVQEGELIKTAHFSIYLFHMPAFVLATGYFAKNYMKKDVPDVRKLMGILILYVVYKLLICVTKYVLAGKYIDLKLFESSAAPWYLLAMFFWYIFLPLFAKFKPTASVGFALILALLIGTNEQVGSFLALSRTIVFFPFFLIGYYFDGKKIEKMTSLINKIVSAIILATVVVLVFFGWELLDKYGEIIYGGVSYSKLGLDDEIAIMLRILWYVIASIMTVALMCLVPKRKLAISYIGSRTLSIYILHRIIREVFDDLYLYKYFDKNEVLLLIGCVVLSLVITFICAAKPFNNLFQKAFKLKFTKTVIDK